MWSLHCAAAGDRALAKGVCYETRGSTHQSGHCRGQPPEGQRVWDDACAAAAGPRGCGGLPGEWDAKCCPRPPRWYYWEPASPGSRCDSCADSKRGESAGTQLAADGLSYKWQWSCCCRSETVCGSESG